MIDLHVHSSASDGTLSPSELAARGVGFGLMAITDHDNCDGCAEFLSADGCARRLAGIELSIDPGEGYRRLHLLGLGIDPVHPGLRAFLQRILDGRNARNARILENFARIGIAIAPDDIARYAHGVVLARPHFANWLVAHHYAADKAEAFAKYLTAESPVETRCYEARYRPLQEEAIEVVHAAGGLAVAAHPRYWSDDPAMLERGFAVLREKGLDGVEAIYAANRPDETILHLRLAHAAGLLVTAGSDFHGDNKPDIALGMQVKDESTLVARILDALASRRTGVK